ncbi:MAG: bifunctional diguanylate cyclase/phosphodiesterase [Sandaracinaceae bacterium]|nr:bifunctional diguanylate cyclase/phosphodiesterase [Sandaracinaceae bacterium]
MTSDDQALIDQLRVACAITRMPAGVIFRLSGNHARRVVTYGPPELVADVPLEAPAWRLAREAPALVPIVGRGPAAPEIALFPPSVGVNAAVTVPVEQEGRQFGAIVLVDREAREDLEGTDVTALATVASHIVIHLAPPTPVRGVMRPRKETLPPHVRDLAAWPLSVGAHDAVTGLPDRRMLEEPVEVALDDAEREGTGVAVAILALDRFQRIDDWLGRDVGDGLLRQVAERLLDTTTENDLVGRGSGDEFLAVLTGHPRGASALALADRMLQSVREPFHVQGYELSLSASVGIARYPEDANDGGSLLRYAGIALHRAKASRRRGRIECFTAELREQVERRGDLERHLRRALGAGELLLHYQPKVALDSRRSTELEALIRWQRHDGLVSPGHFLPVAEESELIVPIGSWVLLEACRQVSRWRAAGLDIECVSVNVSAHQFARADFVGTVQRVLSSTRVDPRHLELEVTETSLMDDVQAAVEKLSALRELGVRVSVDDFGTGYSSLAYLQRLPVDVLKIDRAFVKDLDVGGVAQQHATALTQAITGLGHSLGLEVLAEGVETVAQLDALVTLGVDAVQGYFFSRPLDASRVPDFFTLQDSVARRSSAT